MYYLFQINAGLSLIPDFINWLKWAVDCFISILNQLENGTGDLVNAVCLLFILS